MSKTEVVIVGGGPGGAASALFLAERGVSSTIVEKDDHPRFHIGESLTGECGNVVRSLGLEDEMATAGHAVKRGVKVYGRQAKNAFWVPVVGVSPDGRRKRGTTWQVRRSTYDAMLLDAARSRGVEVRRARALHPLVGEDGSVEGVRVESPSGRQEDLPSEVLIDASGLSTFLSRAGLIGPKEPGNYAKQVAFFSHVTGAVRDLGMEGDTTLIFYREKYHWAWFIPLDDEVVSVGVVVPNQYFREHRQGNHDFLAREIRDLNPELAWRVAEARFVEPTRVIANYSYRIREFTGNGYLCVGDAHRFVDPVFSFGLSFAMHEARLAARAVADHLDGAGRETHDPFADFREVAERGQDVIQDMLDCFWEHPLPFLFFVHDQFRNDFVDLFAGRVYTGNESPGLRTLRGLLAKSRGPA